MRSIFLIAANSAAYFLFIYKCFSLIEGMLYGKHYGPSFRLFIGAVNAGLMVTMALYIPINIAYFITVAVLFAELLIIFRKSLKDTLFVSVAVMMNIMCLRGMVISVFALATRGTLYSVCTFGAFPWRLVRFQRARMDRGICNNAFYPNGRPSLYYAKQNAVQIYNHLVIPLCFVYVQKLVYLCKGSLYARHVY
ncbi:MAG: hypothetical protein GXY01_04050 [Clostridiales bacterium]|jgi:hypothetical protein|nr:hypothetical protein [Clostridiales bacterium]